MHTTDEDVGQRVAEARQTAKLTQSQLATRMRQMGWKWSQSGVALIEKGNQPLRFREAVDLCDILSADLATLTGSANDGTPEVRRAAGYLAVLAGEIGERLEVYEIARRQLARSADWTRAPMDSHLAAEVQFRLDLSPVALAQAFARRNAETLGERPKRAVKSNEERYFETWERDNGEHPEA